ncbi:PKD domain-containing protein [Desertivirga xinjiangensis]|uniref:PKD domain-containing protein n=1 Tax=Desertivirga xinjiangensis TaxID=539206 RepID=UPI002108D6F5|nr:PKD domain-containing protein [Pedobacter xinjiangensis]
MLLRRILYMVFFTCIVFGALRSGAQGTSNKGTDFWVVYAGHVDSTASRLTLFITSETASNVTITAGNDTLSKVSLIANQARAVVINPNQVDVYVDIRDGIESQKGIHISSDKPVVVYSMISHEARSAACLVFPTRALGSDYYAIAYDQIESSRFETRLSQFTIVGVEDSTKIEITPSQNSVANAAHRAGVPFGIILNKGDVYQYQSTGDLSGSRIRTATGCTPFAVFSGSSKNGFCEDGNTTNPNSPSGHDNLYQQLLPVTAWGKNFISAPFYNTLHGSVDIYRIQVAEDSTTVKINGSTTSINGDTLANPYMKGSIITFFSQEANVINADKPINVTQFQTSQNCNPQNEGYQGNQIPYPGDPEMTILNPIEQTLKDVTVYSAISTAAAPTSITKHFINVIIKTVDAGTLSVDGALIPAANFTPINAEYSYTVIDVTQSSQTNPTHRVRADGGFVAIAYGYGQFESYGYLAGSDLKNLNKFILPENSSTGQALTSGCTGSPFNLFVVLPFMTPRLTWELDSGVIITDTNPQYTVITQNGETLYKYKYLNTSLSYPEPGSYLIKASAINPAPIGCDPNEVIELSYEVFDFPIADFQTSAPLCQGLPVIITDKSSGNGQNISKWHWDFGDGSPVETRLSADPFTHVYAASGNYTISLVVETGCLSQAKTLAVNVNPSATARFVYTAPACETLEVAFTDQSVISAGSVEKWIWDFGDPASGLKNVSDIQNPVHIFSQSGTYRVKLTVTSDQGCATATELDVIVNILPLANFTVPEVCLTDAAIFVNTTSFAGNAAELHYTWDFGDPDGVNNISQQKDGAHRFSGEGDFRVRLTVTSASGCKTIEEKIVTVSSPNPQADFSMSQGSICSGSEVVFEDKSSVRTGSITRIEWYFDDTEHANSPSFSLAEDNPQDVPGKKYSFTYPVTHNTTPKLINVRMRVFSGENCYNDHVQQLTITGKPQIEFNPSVAVCEQDDAFQLSAREINGFAASQERYSGDGVSPEGIFNPRLAGVGNHTIIYTFITTDGCQEEGSQTIRVNPMPQISEISDVTMIRGGEVRLPVEAEGQNLTYKWTPSAGLSNDGVLNPVASPAEETSYQLTISSGAGCTITANVLVKIKESPEIPNAFSPNGDGINDTWNIPYLQTLPKATIKIFNRYGQVVFSSGQYHEAWDGTDHSKELPSGVYYYIIEPNNGKKRHSGSITLLR